LEEWDYTASDYKPKIIKLTYTGREDTLPLSDESDKVGLMESAITLDIIDISGDNFKLSGRDTLAEQFILKYRFLLI